MFGSSRRRRPLTTPLNLASANPNATTAAASAYMSASNYNPNKALSSAAAAAALRARPHTPTNVAEVQTKRTMRRSASVSSAGSGTRGGLASRHNRPERPGSSASMTERTFRSPSPHRPSLATHGQHPPVPQIPDNHRSSASAKSKVAGVGMQNFYTASEKMRNEPSSFHVGPTGDTSNVRKVDLALGASVSPQNSVDPQPARPESRSSVNFSYPTTFRTQSPPAPLVSPTGSRATASLPQPPIAISNPSRRHSSHCGTQAKQHLVYDPNSRRMVPAPIDDGIQSHLKHAPEKPSRRRESGSRSGGKQVAKETIPTFKMTLVEESPDLPGPHAQNQPAIEPMPAVHVTPQQEESFGETTMRTDIFDVSSMKPRSPEPSATEPESPRSLVRKPYNDMGYKQHPTPSAHSIASTQDQLAADEEQTLDAVSPWQSPLNVLEILDAIPTRQILFDGSHPQHRQPEPESNDNETAENGGVLSSIDQSGLLAPSSGQRLTVLENKPVVGLVGEFDNLRRSSSNSPARQARFAPRPAEDIAIRHVPLPRSASPIKSAMKHTISTSQESSLLDSSDLPDQKEEATTYRKKAVRVSFDDQSIVFTGEPNPVAEVDSSAVQGPQGVKRTWFSNLGRGRKKEITLDDDEIMKPRPALPSFGSIRDKKIRELGERPLVRPLEPACPSVSLPSSTLRPQSSSSMNDSESAEEPSLGQSSDHALGAVFLQDQTSRNAANISRFREPLPPVVTSVEGCGYSSESLLGSDSEEHLSSAVESAPSPTQPSISDISSVKLDLDDNDSNGDTSTAMDISRGEQRTPEVMIIQQQRASKNLTIQTIPVASEHDLRADDSPDSPDSPTSPQYLVPGGFPDYEADISHDSEFTAAECSFTDNRPTTTVADADQGHALDTTIPEADLSDDESEESIYSDAFEDIPAVESGGFLSLDAIIQNPINGGSRISTLGASENMPAVTSHPHCDASLQHEESSQVQSIPHPNDWEQAKAFWRSLTAEKRRQLELEAAEEAGADGDREEVSLPARRNSTKRQSPERAQSAQGIPLKQEPRVQILAKGEQLSKPASMQPQSGFRKTPRLNGDAPSTLMPSTTPFLGPDQAAKPRKRSSTLSTPRSQPAAQVMHTLQRRGSDTSDSSFKRHHPPLSGTFGFRRTLREPAPVQPHPKPVRGSGRFILRSLSPTRTTNNPSGGMKLTLRTPGGSSTERKRSSVHFPLLSRSLRGPPKDSKWSSRFEDSSEDEGTATCFRSRIHDSSDDEVVKDHLPTFVRETKRPAEATPHGSLTAASISRPTPVPELEEEEDSPELPDSDDCLMPSPLQRPRTRVSSGEYAAFGGMGRANSGAIGTSTLGGSKSGRGSVAPTFSPTFSPPTLPVPERRGSLLGMLRLNKKTDQFDKMQTSEPVDRASRRGTSFEQSRQVKDFGDQTFSTKFQKSSSMSGRDNSNKGWQRSISADNNFSRNVTTGEMDAPKFEDRAQYEVDNSSYEAPGPHKKKKFGTLRRMFKLDD